MYWCNDGIADNNHDGDDNGGNDEDVTMTWCVDVMMWCRWWW